jgi:hypothetical protein
MANDKRPAKDKWLLLSPDLDRTLSPLLNLFQGEQACKVYLTVSSITAFGSFNFMQHGSVDRRHPTSDQGAAVKTTCNTI